MSDERKVENPQTKKYMTKAEAQELTLRLRNNSKSFASLLRKGWDAQVWLVLGYTCYSDWVRAEFGWSKGHASRLLAISVVSDLIAETALMPAGFELNDRQTRAVIAYGRAEFLRLVATTVGESTDVAKNAREVARLVSALQKLEKPAGKSSGKVINYLEEKERLRAKQGDTKRVSGGVRDARWAVASVSSFRTQATLLPSAGSLKRTTIERGIELLSEIRAVLADRLSMVEAVAA